MIDRFTDRRVIITGAGSGIGAATVARLLDEGATVAAFDISAAGAEGHRSGRRRGGHRQATHHRRIGHLARRRCHRESRCGRGRSRGLDVLVNVAGMQTCSHTHETTLEDWNRTLAVNLTGTFLMTRQALPALLQSGRGVVINFTSTSATYATLHGRLRGQLILGRRYAAGGQALAAGLFAGAIRAGIPIWLNSALSELVSDGTRVTGAIVDHDGKKISITARRGVVLAAGGFDHQMDMRWKFQSESLGSNLSLGAESNTGDAIRIGQDIGADIALMDQSWWFPAVAPLPGSAPAVMLAERSLPGSFIVDEHGKRFVNESTDYMSFGQRLLELEAAGTPVETMWIVFDQQYRNSYVFAAERFPPRMPIPRRWYDAGIAVRAQDVHELATKMGVPVDEFGATVTRFNENSFAGEDLTSAAAAVPMTAITATPTITPNPNLRPLVKGPFYAVKLVLSDLGTCGASALMSAPACSAKTTPSSTACTRSATPLQMPLARSTRGGPARPSRRDWSTATLPHSMPPEVERHRDSAWGP